MNKYQKAFDTITNTLICYMIRRDLYPLPSDDEIYNAQMVLLKLVDKEKEIELFKEFIESLEYAKTGEFND